MPQTGYQWNTYHLEQCKQKLGQVMLSDEHTLVSFRQDFGKLIHSDPRAVCEPTTTDGLQSLIHYAHEHQLPLTLHGNGMSQNGQSLAIPGGLILSMKHFNRAYEAEKQSIWVEANTSWGSLLEQSLKQSLIPYVFPYNCHLSIGGVLSAGGIGSSSFKFGSAIAHVNSLEVLQANGDLVQVDKQSPLMQACLGGQGRFGLITKACIALRPCCQSVRTFFLVYLDKETWLQDLLSCKNKADYIESFCTPAVQGTKLSAKGRLPFAQWLYGIHVSVEYDQYAPDFSDLALNPWKVLHIQDESIHAYVHRHDSRFSTMKMTGQWELAHPWYECYVSAAQLDNLEEILATLPIHYASLVHIVAIANPAPTGFLILPREKNIFSFMILNPGLPKALIPSCLDTIKDLDARLLPQGGKRYLSGFIGEAPDREFWQNHFGERYSDWLNLKKIYDPHHIFCSALHRS